MTPNYLTGYTLVVEHFRRNLLWYSIGALFAANLSIYYAVFAEERRGLTIAFLDVGQGDAIFIESPSGNQILIDGGPNAKVLQELGSLMPFYDRSIDMLIVTNPDADHFAGFLDVLHTYNVSTVLEPGTVGASSLYSEFGKAVKAEGAARILARRGQRINLGGGAYLDVLFPDRDVSLMATNDGSIVARLVYGESEVMLTGDTTKKIEEYLVTLDRKNLMSDVLKVAHHGSRTSTSASFVAAVAPEYAVISSGVDNRYGHPHQETLDTLTKFGTEILRTDTNSTIRMLLSGEGISVKK